VFVYRSGRELTAMAKTNRSRARCVVSTKLWLTARLMAVLRAVADRDTVQNIAKSTAYRAAPAIVNRAVLPVMGVAMAWGLKPRGVGLQGVRWCLGIGVPVLGFQCMGESARP
jgi:hypothetical protein